MEERELNNTSPKTLKENVSDVIVYGDPDTWILICKVSSKEQNFMKTTKAMNVLNDCIIQTETYEKGMISQSLVRVPNTNYNKEGKPFYPSIHNQLKNR